MDPMLDPALLDPTLMGGDPSMGGAMPPMTPAPPPMDPSMPVPDPNVPPMDPSMPPGDPMMLAGDPMAGQMTPFPPDPGMLPDPAAMLGMGGPPPAAPPMVIPPPVAAGMYGVGELDPLADPTVPFGGDWEVVEDGDEDGYSDLDSALTPPRQALVEEYGPVPTAAQLARPEPRLDWVLEDLEILKTDHHERLMQARESVERQALDTIGLYHGDDKLMRLGLVEPVKLSDLRDEIEDCKAMLEGMELGVKSLYREAIGKEEARAKEAAVRFYHESESLTHLRTYGIDLMESMVYHLTVLGGLVGFDAPDPMNEQTGLQMRLIDPMTCFPVEGSGGLAAMYRSYRAKPSELLDWYGDEAGTVEEVLYGIAAEHATGRQFPSEFELEAVEYWDDMWFLLAYGDQLVKVERHGLCRVPFRVVVMGGDLDPVINTSAWTEAMEGFDPTTGKIVGPFSRRALDIARHWAPFLRRRWEAHDTEEKIATRAATGFRNSFDPALLVTRTNMTADDDLPKLQTGRGGMTEFQEGEKADILPLVPDPNLTNVMMGIVGQNKATGMATGVVSGALQNSQNTGTALDIGQAAGNRKYTPVIKRIQSFIQLRAIDRLETVRDWGPTMGYDGYRGVVFIPRRTAGGAMPGDAPVYHLDSEMLHRTGCRVEIVLRKFNPETLASRAAGISMMRGAGILPDFDAIELGGWAADPEEVIERLKRDKLASVPEVQQEEMLRTLAMDVVIAESTGDERSFLEAYGRMMFVQELVMENRRARLARMGAGAMGGMGAIPPIPGTAGLGGAGAGMDPIAAGTPTFGGSGRPAPQVDPMQQAGFQGQSMPMMGGATGTQGGRPAQAMLPM